MGSRIRWTFIGATGGATLALLIAMARYAAQWLGPHSAADGATILAFIGATLLGAPLNLAIGPVLEPLKVAASDLLGLRVSYIQLYYAGLVINWTLLGFLFGIWRARRRPAVDDERRQEGGPVQPNA